MSTRRKVFAALALPNGQRPSTTESFMSRFKPVLIATSTVMLFSAVHVEGQTTLPADSDGYEHAEVFLPDNSRFEVADLMIEGDRVSFRRENANTRTELQLGDVAAIRVRTGNEGLQWAGYGAVAGALTGAYAAYQINNNSLGSETSYAPWVVGFAAGEALLFYIIGSRRATWNGIYANETTAVRIVPLMLPSSVGVRVSLNLR